MLRPAEASAVFILLLRLRSDALLRKVICDEYVSTAIPTPSQSSDEDIRLSVDVPSTLDKLSVCILLVVTEHARMAVSYTHLTLPTKRIV